MKFSYSYSYCEWNGRFKNKQASSQNIIKEVKL